MYYRGVRVTKNNKENNVEQEGIYRGVKHDGKADKTKMKSGKYRGVEWNATSAAKEPTN